MYSYATVSSLRFAGTTDRGVVVRLVLEIYGFPEATNVVHVPVAVAVVVVRFSTY